jgi:predicted CXXCH cytochrome family protein
MNVLMNMRILIMGLALFFLLPAPGYSARKHECGFCHISHAGKGMLLLNESVNDLCLGCHPDKKGIGEHKIDIVPSRQVEGLPLGRDGKITCITCHDPHLWSSLNLLRIEPPELCLKCHSQY